jgi:hypothetical protein
VRLSLDSTNIQHEKLVFELVKPFIDGFSISTDSQPSLTKMEIDANDNDDDDDDENKDKNDDEQQQQSKRKSKELPSAKKNLKKKKK